jgi:hypothetical protein
MLEIVLAAVEASKAIQYGAASYGSVPDEGLPAYSQQVLPRSLAVGTRGYITKIVNQINGCYEKGWFDACAVMIRRLIETLIIESFEKHKISDRIKTQSGDFLQLNDLVDKVLAEKSWNLGRDSRRALPRLKSVGDKSAHSRRFTARRWDIDRTLSDLRAVTEELLYIAGLK